MEILHTYIHTYILSRRSKSLFRKELLMKVTTHSDLFSDLVLPFITFAYLVTHVFFY